MHVVEGDEVVVTFPYGDVVCAMLALLFTYAHVSEYVSVWSYPYSLEFLKGVIGHMSFEKMV